MAEHPPTSNPTPWAEGRPTKTDVDMECDDDDSGLVGISAFSDTASITSSIVKYRVENGRTYHAYKAGSYILPNDDRENDRLDQQHHLALLTLDDQLFIAPVDKDKMKRVLDAGCGSIRDWPKFFEQAYQNLSPGGFIELMDPIYPVTSDDETVSKDSAVYKWSSLMNEAATKMGSGLDSALRYKEQLIEAGFVNVVETPYKWPMNTWPQDRKTKELGAWGNVNLVGGAQGLSLALFTKVLGWSHAQLEVFLVDVRKDLCDKNLHGYWRVNVVYGQKPE
ncbi:hypothetical protein CEP51_000044 [Fusarium floridanum]|uniref:Methyltransferase tdiE n=1 Tax=Fusarium floridanum TaxID=1325733 RepID=A0A428SPX2_9HYPO|nr:hypothetical protein CEP51_000044 [Fusarium floridanum]